MQDRCRFNCDRCQYSTSKRQHWQQHILSIRHKRIVGYQEINMRAPKGQRNIPCPTCGVAYKSRSGLWKHQKRCSGVTASGYLVTENATLRQELCEQRKLIEKLVDQQNKMIPKIGNNNNNNRISINLFLRDKCKDAMNLTQFLDNIQVSLEDLRYTNEHGFVKGISNIFNKHLTDMKITERPIHCSDQKRLQFYVKDDDFWDRDRGHRKLDKTIRVLEKKQIIQLKEWERRHPEYMDDTKLNREWNRMIYNMMGGIDEIARKRNAKNIKKSICRGITVKGALAD